MILEVAILDVIPGKTSDFELSFRASSEIISKARGWLGHELQKCLEVPNRYILLVKWENLEDHTVGFRKSPAYELWKQNLHHYYDPFPVVEHFTMILEKPQKSGDLI